MLTTDGDVYRSGIDVVVTATPAVPGRPPSPYVLELLAQTLKTHPEVDPATGHLRFTLRIPGAIRDSTAVEIALSLVRVAFYTIGLRGWAATAAVGPVEPNAP